MVDVILTLVLILLTFIISLKLKLDNAIIQAILNLIPLTILTIRLYYNHPKNYFHFIGLINRNVKYSMNIKMKNCNIDKQCYLNICNKLSKIYGNSGKIVKQNIGNLIYKSYLEVDACLIEVNYHMEECTLYVEEKSKTKFRIFAMDVDKICTELIEFFAKTNFTYESELVSITLNFLNRNQEDKGNPFHKKFFYDFKNCNTKLNFIGNAGTRFEITNRNIIISSENIKSIKDDLKKEMLLL